MRNALYITFVLILTVVVLPAKADSVDNKTQSDESDGSRANFVHLIPLLDEEGKKITADGEPVMPFSVRRTCSDCHINDEVYHSYDKIRQGWHFNAVEPNVPPGRIGQPWIFVDAPTATQLPLSYRQWPGAFRPDEVGLTTWQFVQLFGRQMPGSGPAEIDSDNFEEVLRGFVSGKLEINCLSCHNADPGQSQAEYALQVARQNYRWAATGACEFAMVTGSAAKMPDTYDYKMPELLDNPELRPPTVHYRKGIFDSKDQVLFDIVRKVPNERCYFCHSNVDMTGREAQKWSADEDVHLAAGLNCVDCHRNDVDHNITRGYEREDCASTNPLAGELSCKACHVRDESLSVPAAGRLGAPVAKHKGMPTVHFDKLSCTACHSGPWPAETTIRGKTSRAHALGTLNVNKSDEVLPHIIEPVFAEQQGIGAAYLGGLLVLSSDGKIAPHKLVWPAFWGRLKEQKVTPMDIEIVRPITAKIISSEKTRRTGDWPDLTEQQIKRVLSLLATQTEGQPVYIAGGKLFRLNSSGKLSVEEHNAAQPYLWPIAHNVRPAAQSLGINGCEDCHSIDGAFSFGMVEVDTPVVSERGSYKKMVEFQDVDATYMKLFAITFIFRPWLKAVSIAASVILGAILLLYALKALARITKILAGED